MKKNFTANLRVFDPHANKGGVILTATDANDAIRQLCDMFSTEEFRNCLVPDHNEPDYEPLPLTHGYATIYEGDWEELDEADLEFVTVALVRRPEK